MKTINDELMTIKEVADFLKLKSNSAVYKMKDKGVLKPVKMPSTGQGFKAAVRFWKSEVIKTLENHQ